MIVNCYLFTTFAAMNQLKFIAMIPARYASTRFPGKPLAMLGGKMVIERVYEQVSRVIADAYDMFEAERKITTAKYTTYLNKQVSKEVDKVYDEMLRSKNIDGIVAAQNVTAAQNRALKTNIDALAADVKASTDAQNKELKNVIKTLDKRSKSAPDVSH